MTTPSPVSQDPWQVIERDGFSLRVDPQRQSPLAFALSIAQGLDSRPRLSSDIVANVANNDDGAGATVKALAEQLTLDQIQIFLAVVDEGSFAKAGKKLNRAQSAVTYGIQKLEAQIGLPLFDVTTRRSRMGRLAGPKIVTESPRALSAFALL